MFSPLFLSSLWPVDKIVLCGDFNFVEQLELDRLSFSARSVSRTDYHAFLEASAHLQLSGVFHSFSLFVRSKPSPQQLMDHPPALIGFTPHPHSSRISSGSRMSLSPPVFLITPVVFGFLSPSPPC